MYCSIWDYKIVPSFVLHRPITCPPQEISACQQKQVLLAPCQNEPKQIWPLFLRRLHQSYYIHDTYLGNDWVVARLARVLREIPFTPKLQQIFIQIRVQVIGVNMASGSSILAYVTTESLVRIGKYCVRIEHEGSKNERRRTPHLHKKNTDSFVNTCRRPRWQTKTGLRQSVNPYEVGVHRWHKITL